MKPKTKLISVRAALACIALLAGGMLIARKASPDETNPYYTIEYELVRVTRVLVDNYEVDHDAEDALRGSQSLMVTVLTGRFKGDLQPVNNYLGPMHEKPAKEGTVLTVTITSDSREDGYQISVVNYDLTLLLAGILAVFVAAVVIVGRFKGAMSLLGLIYSLAAIIFFFVPLWLKGYPAIPLALITCVLITVFAFSVLGGFTRKTVSAMIGTVLRRSGCSTNHRPSRGSR